MAINVFSSELSSQVSNNMIKMVNSSSNMIKKHLLKRLKKFTQQLKNNTQLLLWDSSFLDWENGLINRIRRCSEKS